MSDFARMRANESRVLTRSCEALLGLCQGLLADNVLNEIELRFLDLWLHDHPDIADVWPGVVIADRIRKIVADGIVTEDELHQLNDLLSSMLGGNWQETGAASGLPTSLPVQDDTVVVWPDRKFCFSGKFVFGTRSACESFVIASGGIVNKSITKDLDFLVVGTFVSPDWLNTSFGRKIEKTVGYQQEGCKVRIISEKHWSASIERS